MEEFQGVANGQPAPRWRSRFIDCLGFGLAIEDVLHDKDGRQLRLVVRDGYGNILHYEDHGEGRRESTQQRIGKQD
jgi:hypothetical protein